MVCLPFPLTAPFHLPGAGDYTEEWVSCLCYCTVVGRGVQTTDRQTAVDAKELSKQLQGHLVQVLCFVGAIILFLLPHCFFFPSSFSFLSLYSVDAIVSQVFCKLCGYGNFFIGQWCGDSSGMEFFSFAITFSKHLKNHFGLWFSALDKY